MLDGLNLSDPEIDRLPSEVIYADNEDRPPVGLELT
jgi:hypothetical protein